MGSVRSIVVERDRRRLRALLATRRNGKVAVERVLVAELPDAIDEDDASAVGKWISQRLGDAGFGRRAKATIALAREHVVFKKMQLPTVDPDELPEMTRLAFARELPFDASAAVIDYAITKVNGSSTNLLAVAAPSAIIERSKEVAKASGLKVDRIGLRGLGSAALLQSLGRKVTGRNLVIDVTGGNVEFCIVDDGAVLMSRAAMLAGDDPREIADQVLTETRRTWMSSRITEGESDVRHVVFLGDRAVADLVLRPIGEMLSTEVIRLDRHPLVSCDAGAMDRVWPLAGLLLECELRPDTIDFNAPHQPPDRAAIKRKRLAMAAGIGAVLVFGGWTVRDRTLSALEDELEGLDTLDLRLTQDYARLYRDRLKLEHVEQWESVDVPYLAHLQYLHDVVPPPPWVVLDGWTGSLDFRGAEFDGKAEKDKWSTPYAVTFVIDGESVDRATADRVRAALSAPEGYVLSSSGSDAKAGKRLAEGFSYRLASGTAAPPRPKAGVDSAANDAPQAGPGS